jgi:signal transduction histidine kinase/PAS domain-containing protein
VIEQLSTSGLLTSGYAAPASPHAAFTQDSEALSALFARVTGQLLSTLRADACAIYLREDEPGTAHLLQAVTAGDGPMLPSAIHLDPNAYLRATTAPLSVPILVGHATDEPLHVLLGTACPIRLHDSLAGVLVTVLPEGRDLDATDLGLMAFASRLVSVAIDQSSDRRLDPAEWHFLEPILDESTSAIIAREPTGEIVHVNSVARRLFDVARDTAIVHVNETSLIRALDLRDQWEQPIKPAMLPHNIIRAGQPAQDLVVSGRFPNDNTRRWMLLHAFGLNGARRKIALAVTVIRDITVAPIEQSSLHLRSRIAEHLRSRPPDIAAIERELAGYIEGGCTISLDSLGMGADVRWSTATHFSASQSRLRASDVSEGVAAKELKLACGHLHLPTSVGVRPATPARDQGLASPHMVVIPIEGGDGTILGRMRCQRDRMAPCFTAEQIELLADLCGRIGLAVANARLHASLVDEQRLLADAMRRLRDAEEGERRKMALSIHDGHAHDAASVAQQLELLAYRFAPVGIDESQELARAQLLARRAVNETRMLIAGLRPTMLENRGLGPAVHEVVDQLRADGWAVRYTENVTGLRYREDVEIDVYRLCQEALSNIRKHAGVTTVDVVIDHSETGIRVEIRDCGKGFNPAVKPNSTSSSEHVGLDGMRERITRIGGTISIESTPGVGTRVVATIPNPDAIPD